MGGFSWSWDELWGWFDQIDEPNTKGWMLNQILDIKWLQRLTVDGQVDVLSSAPFDILKYLKKWYPDCLKSETVSILNEHLKARYKPKRRTKRK